MIFQIKLRWLLNLPFAITAQIADTIRSDIEWNRRVRSSPWAGGRSVSKLHETTGWSIPSAAPSTALRVDRSAIKLEGFGLRPHAEHPLGRLFRAFAFCERVGFGDLYV